MKKTIKKLAGVCTLAVAAIAIPLTVYAYLQSEPKQMNEFIIGEDKATVTEVFTEPSTMQISNAFEKQVMVENTGTSEQFVRVYLDFSDSRVRDKSTVIYKKNADEKINSEKNWSAFLNELPENWVYISDTATGEDKSLVGYFYYKKKLKPQEKTTTLIEGINTVFGDGGSTDNITDFDIIVYSESVQTTEINSGKVYTDTEWKDAWKSFLKDSTLIIP